MNTPYLGRSYKEDEIISAFKQRGLPLPSKFEEKELLEDLIISAVNKALSKSQEESQNRMNAVTGNMLGGMKIPGR